MCIELTKRSAKLGNIATEEDPEDVRLAIDSTIANLKRAFLIMALSVFLAWVTMLYPLYEQLP